MVSSCYGLVDNKDSSFHCKVLSLWVTWALKGCKRCQRHALYIQFSCCSHTGCSVICLVTCSRSESASSDEVIIVGCFFKKAWSGYLFSLNKLSVMFHTKCYFNMDRFSTFVIIFVF